MFMEIFECILLLLLIVCAVATVTSKNLMVSMIIFMAYSVIMSVIWIILKAPDLSVTEAAVGAGISSILMFMTIRKLKDIKKEHNEEKH